MEMKLLKSCLRLLPLLLPFLLLQQCQRDETELVEIASIEEIPLNLPAIIFGALEADRYVVVKSLTYYGCYGTSYEVTGAFGEEGAAAGRLSVNGINIPIRQSEGKTWYYYESTAEEMNQALEDGEIICTLSSSSPRFASFSQTLPFSRDLCASSSLGAKSEFPKSEDLLIEWDTDPNFGSVYVAICAPGLPCIMREVPDTGQYTVEKEAFAGFNVGDYVFFIVGRGHAEAITQTDGQEIALITVRVAHFPDIYVTE